MNNLPPGVTQSMIDGPTRKADPDLDDWAANDPDGFDDALADLYADEAVELHDAMKSMDADAIKSIRRRINSRMESALQSEIDGGTGWVAKWFDE